MLKAVLIRTYLGKEKEFRKCLSLGPQLLDDPPWIVVGGAPDLDVTREPPNQVTNLASSTHSSFLLFSHVSYRPGK